MATIASYLPESQIITLGVDLPALADPTALAGFTTPEQFGFFFHEWVHFLHNISTINGFSLFSVQVALWSNFRGTMNKSGLSEGSVNMDSELTLDNKNLISYLASNRKKNKCNLPNNAQLHQLSFVETKLHKMEVANENVISTSLIKCEIDYSSQRYDVEIGVSEILESAAFMLECEFIEKLNGTLQGAPIYPYHLVKGLAGKIAPSLDNHIIICCMLASLQSNDPPRILFNLLKDAELLLVNEHRYDVLVDHVKNQMKDQLDNIDKSLEQIRNLFPVDEPMGRFIKLTLNRIKNNLNYRMQNPFFEFFIIDETSVCANNIENFIRQFGGCTIIQQRSGDNEQLERDIMYDFALPEHDEAVAFGWKMARACFHFTLIHFGLSGEINNTNNLKKKCKCPFYTVCSSPIRAINSNVCAETPWETKHVMDNKDCYYAAAIKATSPPPELQI